MMQVKYTNIAIDDLNHAYDFIYQDSPKSARKVIETIELHINKLTDFPDIGKKGRVLRTQEMPVTGLPFIIIYRHKKDTIEIISILHTSRKYPD